MTSWCKLTLVGVIWLDCRQTTPSSGHKQTSLPQAVTVSKKTQTTPRFFFTYIYSYYIIFIYSMFIIYLYIYLYIYADIYIWLCCHSRWYLQNKNKITKKKKNTSQFSAMPWAHKVWLQNIVKIKTWGGRIHFTWMSRYCCVARFVCSAEDVQL